VRVEDAGEHGAEAWMAVAAFDMNGPKAGGQSFRHFTGKREGECPHLLVLPSELSVALVFALSL
jgi:hypothetical protein